MNQIVLFMLAISLCASAPSRAANASANSEQESPVGTINFKWHCPAKPPMINFLANLSLTNRHDSPMWFIMPYHCGGSLATNGVFNVPAYKSPFVENIYYGRVKDGFGETIVVSLIGQFHALLLPPHSSLRITGYAFSCWRDPQADSQVVYEATSLLLGEQTYQQWRGFPVTTSVNIDVPLQIEMDKDIAKYAKDRRLQYYNHPRLFPNETPGTVTASIVSRNVISIAGYVPKHKKQAQPSVGGDGKPAPQP